MASLTRAERLKKYGLNRDGSVNEELQRQNADVFTRVGETLLDVGGTFAKSVVRGAEGLVEGVVGVAGAVGGLFGADTQWAEDIITQTWTEDVFSGLPEATKNSYINELSEGGQETVRGIIDGVGQAASAIGLSFVNPAAAVAYMGTSAAGRSTEEALYDGANYTDALAYGTTQGVLESALEYVTGGVSRLAKIGGKQAIKSTGKLIAGEALQEAAQEGIQGAINPITKQIYKGSEALDEYKQEGFWQDVGKQALIGGISGSMGAGMGVGIQTAAAGGRKQFKVANASAQVQEALNETSEKVAKGKMSDAQLASAVDDISAMNDRLEGFISKLSFEQQQKMFQPNGEKPAKYRIPQGFEWTDNGLVRTSKATEENFNDIIKQGRASVSLLGREKEVSRLLERTGATIYRGELASDEKANYNKVRKLHQALASKGLVRSNLILVDTMEKAEAFNSGDIIVLGKDQLSNEAGMKKILHEVTHFAEGTKEYKKFANFVLSLDIMKDVNARILRTAGYGITQSNIDSALKKLKKGEELTKIEKTYVTEAVAFSAEMLLSDEATIERLCKTDRSLAQKILRKIKEFIKVINSRFNGDAQMLKELRKAEKLYIKALAKSGTEYLVKQQKAAENKINEEDVDSESEVKYSKKKRSYYNQFNTLALSWASRAETGSLRGFYDRNGLYQIVEATGDDNVYSIFRSIPQGNTALIEYYEEFIDENNEQINRNAEEISRIAQSIEDSERLNDYDSVDVARGLADSKIRKMGEKQSRSNGNGNIEESSRNSRGQFSLKDSTGNTLSQEQAEFFKDSKVRDENGNLLVVYHGTDAYEDFTVFKKGKRGYLGGGIYLTSDENYAKKYAEKNGWKGKIYEAYVRVENPLVVTTANPAVEILGEKVAKRREQENSLPTYWINSNDIRKLKAKGYDGIVWNFGGNTEVSVWESNQIKLTTNKNPTSSSDIRYALKDTVEKDVLEVYGKTYNWKETGYILQDGTRLDLSGRHEGARGGYRSVDHRDIFDIYEDAEDYGTDAMIQFIARGNIRVMPESPGINLQVEPTQEQYKQIESLVERLGWNEKYFSVDFDNEYGDTIDSIEYEGNVSARKVVADIKHYFKEGTVPRQSELSKFRYSLKEIVDENGHSYGMGVKLDSVALEGLSEAERIKEVAKFAKSLAGQTFVAHDAQGNEVDIVIASNRRFKNSRGKRVNANKDLIQKNSKNEVKQETLLLIDEALDVAKYEKSKPTKYSHDWLDDEGKNHWDYWRVYVEDKNNTIWEATLNVANATNGEKVLYDIYPIKKIGRAIKLAATLSIDSIHKEDEKVNSESQFSLKEDTKYELSKGQVTKLKANYTREKAYARKEAEAIVNTVLSDHLDFGEEFGTIANKNKEEVVDILWQGLNGAGGSQGKVAFAVADYIIENAVMQNIYDDVDNDIHIETIEVLKPYLHSVNLDNLKGEISHKGDNSIYAMWGKRKGEAGYGVDQIAQELEEQGFVIKATADADILFEIHSAYRNAVSELKKKTKEVLKNSLSDEELHKLRNDIARDVMIGFDEKGSKSKLSKIIEEYRQKAYGWKSKYYDERSRNTWTNRLLYKVQKARDLKLGTYKNATQFNGNVFDTTIGKLAGIKYAGDLNKSSTRDIVRELCEWYIKNMSLFEGQFDANVAMMMEEVARGKDQLTADELHMLCNVVDYFNHFVTNFNKVYRNGKYVDALPLAEEYINKMKKNESANVGWLKKLSNHYIEYFGDPMTVARRMDKYENGFYTDSMESLRTAAMNAQIDEMEMRADIDAFLENNKKYLEKADKKTVKYLGVDIPLKEAMSLYMTLEREQAILGLAESGIKIGTGEQVSHVDGFGLDTDESLYKSMASDLRKELENQFSQADKQYIDISRKVFNEICREKKKSTDEALRGYSNVANDAYFPIRRATIAKGVDAESLAYEIDRVSNASFNKDVVKGAKQELFIEPIDKVVDRHIRAVAQYANMAAAINEYDILFNIDIGDNKNKPTSIKTTAEHVWTKGSEYFNKLVSDMQGVPATKSDGATWDANKVMGKVRGAYARYQLGANPKVWLTQLSSFFAATNILDVDSIVKGFSIDTKDVDVFCPLAKLRNYDNSAAMAQAVFDRKSMTVSRYKVVNALRRFSDWLMKVIGKMDRFVIKRLFGACQIEVEKKNKLKVGTVENKQKAGELLTKIILETQQNSLATERSAAMRSGHEVAKTLTMFSSDAMKGIGRFFDAIGEFATLKARRKAATDQTEIANIDARLNKVGKQVVKSTSALISSAVFMALVAQGFRWLYNKDDEDEDIMLNMMVDAAGNMLGGLPVVRDIYSKAFEGYDIQGYSYSAINGIIESAVALPEAAGNLFSGDSREFAKAFKDLVNAAGMLTGVPTRNIYNVGYGLTKRISPATAYKIDDAFYSQGYRADLAKALENEDEAMVATIAGLMLNENIGGITDSSVRKNIDDLVKKGFDVLPKGVSTQITYNDETVELSASQQKRFKEVYNVANESLASLVKLPQYSKATDEVKAKAIRFVFDTYHNLAKQDVLGVELETKNVLFAEAIDLAKLAIIVATVNQMTADTKNGKIVSGSKKIKVQQYVNSLSLTAAQKYMIMGYLGYKNANGEAQVKAYISSLKLTASEKEKLLSYSGY